MQALIAQLEQLLSQRQRLVRQLESLPAAYMADAVDTAHGARTTYTANTAGHAWEDTQRRAALLAKLAQLGGRQAAVLDALAAVLPPAGRVPIRTAIVRSATAFTTPAPMRVVPLPIPAPSTVSW